MTPCASRQIGDLGCDEHQFVFIGGLHRSGTSLLHRCLRSHPDVSGFANLGVREDEGQFVQSVYPRKYGGPGLFAFNPDAHITESSPLVTDDNRCQLYDEWAKHWQTDKRHLLEKSPPNILRSRFLQAMFPTSSFVFVVRHPVAVAMATATWRPYLSLGRLLEHWVRAHEVLHDDLRHLRCSCVVKFERFARAARDQMDQVLVVLGVERPMADMEPVYDDTNGKYFQTWRKMTRSFRKRRLSKRLVQSFEPSVNRFGYSLVDPVAEVDDGCLFDYVLTQ